jgi:heat shock transcription factor, other eukaryote
MASRKRRAPGASPQVQQPSNTQNSYPQETGNISTEPYLNDWNDPSVIGDMSTGLDPALYAYANLAGNMGGVGGQSNHNRIISLDGQNEGIAGGGDNSSGQLVRRNQNQQLAARGSTPWDAFASGQQGGWDHVEEEDEELEQKAMIAKREAQAKRKQIPPFVQKLSR